MTMAKRGPVKQTVKVGPPTEIVAGEFDLRLKTIPVFGSVKHRVRVPPARRESAVAVSPGAMMPPGLVIAFAWVPQNEFVEVCFSNVSTTAISAHGFRAYIAVIGVATEKRRSGTAPLPSQRR